jgi:hypothetical protein
MPDAMPARKWLFLNHDKTGNLQLTNHVAAHHGDSIIGI